MKEISLSEYKNRISYIVDKYSRYNEFSCMKSFNFKSQLTNLDYIQVIPLNCEETLIVRCITQVCEDYRLSLEEISNMLNIKVDTLKRKINNIILVLRNYFNNTLEVKMQDNDSITEYNNKVTIFDVSLSNNTIDILRIMNIYLLKDVTHVDQNSLKTYIGEKEFNRLSEALAFYGIMFDENKKSKQLLNK